MPISSPGRTARVFLGMRLDCAQCHDDPFEPWTQQDFWSFAAFFARISRPQAALESVSTVMQVRDIDRGDVKMPDSEDPVPPKFLDGSRFDESPSAAARRRQLARWLTGPDNPYFARAAVNRVWAHLFGRGIVDPVDGFGKRHPPRSPELLDLLAGRFIANEFDLRTPFARSLCRGPISFPAARRPKIPKRRDWFAQMNVKMLTAEQVYDCISVASMLVAAQPDELPVSARAGRQFQPRRVPAAIQDAGGPRDRVPRRHSAGPYVDERHADRERHRPGGQRLAEVAGGPVLHRRPADRSALSGHAVAAAHPKNGSCSASMYADRIRASIQQPLADILWALLTAPNSR